MQAFVPGGSHGAATYSGDAADAAALKAWVLGLVPDHVQRLSNAGDLAAFLHRCGAAAPGAQAKRQPVASWNLCLLLFTAKDSSPLYKALSTEYNNQIAFAQVSVSNRKLKQALGAKTADTQLLHVCNGDAARAARYTGEMKSKALKAFLGGFAGGKKCRNSTYLTHMRVRVRVLGAS